MKIRKSLFICCVAIFFLNNCSSFKEAGKVLRNEKTSNTDEFLIKKREPLTQPPNYKVMPEPGSAKSRADIDEKSIENILKSSRTKSNNLRNKSSSTEESILKKIK